MIRLEKLNRRIKQLEKWRKMGRFKYALFVGLSFSFFMYVFNPPVDLLFDAIDPPINWKNEYFSWKALFKFIFYSLWIGLTAYYIFWPGNEKSYAKLLKEKADLESEK
jgi:hypothetical protein